MSELLPRLQIEGSTWGWWASKVPDFDTAGWMGILIQVMRLRQLQRCNNNNNKGIKGNKTNRSKG